MRVLVSCPPMLANLGTIPDDLRGIGVELIAPKFDQTLTIEALMDLVPTVDGWIAGDDPATSQVLEAGASGRLKALVKWGVGVDNIDREACTRLGISFSHTPAMFGDEVSDLAVCYLIGLAREVITIHQGVQRGEWVKPAGISLRDKVVGVVGYGDIGKSLCLKLEALGMQVHAYDPFINMSDSGTPIKEWPMDLGRCDFLVFTCALNSDTYHMLSAQTLRACKKGIRIINVARGGLIDEPALVESLNCGHVHSVALDVFEVEPLPMTSKLHVFEKNIFGSHNASNTIDAVVKTNTKAVSQLLDQLGLAS